jgi:branched-chain amino acid transport system permease protein
MNEFLQAGIIGISLGTQYALLALGFTLIFGILGVVNFAHGGFYMLGGYVAYSCVSLVGLPYPLAVLVAVAATAALGWLFELFMIERLVDDHLATLMLTLGLYLVISTGLLTAFGPLSMEFTFPVTGALHLGTIYVPKENLVVLAVCLAAIGALWAGRCGRWRTIGRWRWRKACGRACCFPLPSRLQAALPA